MTKEQIKQIQRALLAAGFDPRGIDGDIGRRTTAAIAAFQESRGLDIKWPGTIGPKTLAALGLDFSKAIEPAGRVLPWMQEARSLMGLHEIRDAKKLDKLLRMDTSEIAWCGGFTGYCISKTLPTEPLPANPLGARNWMKFGREVEITYGAIAVFWRGSRHGWQGHVGFVAGHDKSAVHCLGGNQSNTVSIARVAKNRVLGYRWPLNFAAPNAKLAMSTIGGTLSQNEA